MLECQTYAAFFVFDEHTEVGKLPHVQARNIMELHDAHDY
jgi:hypothetical protein